jgi:hypothetical protein
LCHDPIAGVQIVRPKIHESVFQRLRDSLDGYATIVLPERYAVCNATGMTIKRGETVQVLGPCAALRLTSGPARCSSKEKISSPARTALVIPFVSQQPSSTRAT